MTQDEILAMAQECNLLGMRPHLDGIYEDALVEFAYLIAAHECEEMEKLFKQTLFPQGVNDFDKAFEQVEAIRARSNT